MAYEIAQSSVTGRWYVVTSRNKNGTARHKCDVTDQIETIIAKRTAAIRLQIQEWIDNGVSRADMQAYLNSEEVPNAVG